MWSATLAARCWHQFGAPFPTSMRATAPWCIAPLGRLRVERRANDEASSVMAMCREGLVASLEVGVLLQGALLQLL
jgi:hypothetical protein